MRASKESAEKARQDLAEISEFVELASVKNERRQRQIMKLCTNVGEFLNVAKRKLPTEAAFERDAKRRKRA